MMSTNKKLASGRVPLTWRKLVTAGAIAACAPAVTASFPIPAAAQQQVQSINWSLETKSGRDGSDVQLTVESRWGAGSESMWSNGRRLDELQGVTRAQLLGPPQPIRFALVKEPGRLDCTGTAGGARGSGVCSFTPNVGFATFLDARRIGQPDAHQAFSMTMAGVGRDLVDALDDSHFQRPTVDQLTAMGIHGVTPAYVRALAGLGYHLSADDLISFRIHGVNTDEIRQFATVGPALQRLSPSDLISLRIHGVEPGYIREMAAIDPGLRNVTADDLVSMAIHGVRTALARAYVQYEGGRLTSNGLVDMAIHGVTADYVQRLAAAGYRHLSADDLVSMAIHGVSPDFVQQLSALGYRNLSAEELVNLAIHGVTADYVRRLQQNGMAHVSAEQLVRLRLAGFEPR